MNIHQWFKNHINMIQDNIKAKYWITDVNTMPNETIITKLKEIYESNEYGLIERRILSDVWTEYNVYEIFRDATAVDDTYIWTSYGLFAWSGLANIINEKCIIESEEEELWTVPWYIVRVWSANKLRNLNYISWYNWHGLREYIWKHFEIIGYEQPEWDYLIPYSWYERYKWVFVKDAFGNVYKFPQSVFVRTSIKDLEKHNMKQVMDEIIAQLVDSDKYEITELSDKYQEDLRAFMKTAKILEEKLATDYQAKAKVIYEMQMNTKDILMNNEQITAVEYSPGKELIITTAPIWNSGEPIGKYKIVLKLNSRHLRVTNLDINDTETFQHPHINSSGECCLGEWLNPLMQSYTKQDYITLVSSIISYLESLYDRSVYISLWEFCATHKNKFKYQKEEKETKEQPVVEVVDFTPTDTSDQDEDNPESIVLQVWDQVKIINDSQGWHPVGSIGTIIGVDWNSCRVNCNWVSFSHSIPFLSLVTNTDE